MGGGQYCYHLVDISKYSMGVRFVNVLNFHIVLNMLRITYYNIHLHNVQQELQTVYCNCLYYNFYIIYVQKLETSLLDMNVSIFWS